MTTFMSTNVNLDALMITLWTWALWLGARVIDRGAARRDVVALGAVTAVVVLTKATSYARHPDPRRLRARGTPGAPAGRGTPPGAI